MKQKQTAILIGITMVLLTAGLIGCWLVLRYNQPQKIAEIYQDGTCLYRIDLSEVTETYTISIEGEHGEKNTIRVEPDAIAMESANCPDQLCVEQGAISDGLFPIVCLPHQIYISITSSEGDSYDVEVH